MSLFIFIALNIEVNKLKGDSIIAREFVWQIEKVSFSLNSISLSQVTFVNLVIRCYAKIFQLCTLFEIFDSLVVLDRKSVV